MTNEIESDAKQRPDLFVWNGPIGRDQVENLIAINGWHVPEDLLDLWEQTGGGELFETESLLSPLGSVELGDNIVTFNKALLDRGMPRHYLVFHCGLGGLSAVRQDNIAYVQLHDGTFVETGKYLSLDDWYGKLLRKEYGARYGLTP